MDRDRIIHSIIHNAEKLTDRELELILILMNDVHKGGIYKL